MIGLSKDVKQLQGAIECYRRALTDACDEAERIWLTPSARSSVRDMEVIDGLRADFELVIPGDKP